MARVLAGPLSKNIAADLGINRRVAGNHQASIMHRTGSTALARLALATGAADDRVSSPASD